MPEDYERYAADMAKAGAKASLDALARQVYELNRRVDQIESRLAPKSHPGDGSTWYYSQPGTIHSHNVI